MMSKAKKNKTPHPHNENLEIENVFPEKKNSKKYVPDMRSTVSVKGRKRGERGVLPSHRLVLHHYKENGYKNLSGAIRKSGAYSESVAQRPNVITGTKSWKQLMDLHLPQEHVAQRHAELLDKRDWRKVDNGDGTFTEVDDGPNTAAVAKAVELAYKLRGSFKNEEVVAPSTVMYNLFYKPEVREHMKVFEDNLKESLKNEIIRKNRLDDETEEENQANLEK